MYVFASSIGQAIIFVVAENFEGKREKLSSCLKKISCLVSEADLVDFLLKPAGYNKMKVNRLFIEKGGNNKILATIEQCNIGGGWAVLFSWHEFIYSFFQLLYYLNFIP